MSVFTGGAHDDNAAGLCHNICRGNGLDGLVNILIQGIAAVAGNHDPGGIGNFNTAQAVYIIRSRAVGLLQIAGERGNGFVGAVDDGVYDKVQSGTSGSLHHIPVNGILFQAPAVGVGTVNQRGAVVGVYGLCGTDAGQYAFSSAGKSGKEMRLDKPFRDQKIRLGCQGVDSQRRAGGQNTQINGGTLLAVMDYDMFPAADFRAKFPDQLLPGSAAVASGGNENGDLRLRRIWASICGTIALLGTGRVWSLASNTILCFPFASSHKGGLPMGFSRAWATSVSAGADGCF